MKKIIEIAILSLVTGEGSFERGLELFNAKIINEKFE